MSNRLEHTKVASRYARALFDSVFAQGQAETVVGDLNEVNRLFESAPVLLSFLENPGISDAEKSQFLAEQITPNVNPWVSRLLELLLENKRMATFPQIVAQYQTLLDQSRNAAQAEVITAVELEEEVRQRIRQTLETTFGLSRVELQHRVDPGLLGGAIVKIQDQVIDGSYMGRLEEMRRQISAI